ncbi:MAG: NUDIX hydrolase [Chloroflexota bacterium]
MPRRSGRIVRDFSAGGVIYRRQDHGIEIALVGQQSPDRWQLPKGTPHQNESREGAAVREAQEETGLIVRLICPLEEIQYWFAVNGQRHFKTVAFYLMEAIGGDTRLHDSEYDESEWFALSIALERLTFANEVEIVQAATRILESTSHDTTAAQLHD